jgi:hypothetical protein
MYSIVQTLADADALLVSSWSLAGSRRPSVMPDPHRRILVVEDEYILADDLQHELEKLGVLVIGPVPTVTMALRLLDATSVLDAPSWTSTCAARRASSWPTP